MKCIGITGGVGCGKTEILQHIQKNYRCKIVLSDLLAKELQQPGKPCYEPLVKLLGEKVLDENGKLEPSKMAKIIFADEELLKQVNEIVHPMVVKTIVEDIRKANKSKQYDFFFVEAALLIEAGFDKICDELWYIYADEAVRKIRLQISRGYSEEKILQIMASQMPEETFRKYCKVVIDNSGNLADSKKQVDKVLEAYLCQM